MNVGNIGLGSLGLGGLDQAELQRRIAQYQSGIGNVPAPTTAPKAVAPKPTPVPYRGGPPTPSFAPVAPKPAPVKTVAPKPAITDNRVPGAGVDYVAPTPTAEKINPFLSSDSDFSGLQNYRDNIVSGGADYKKINDVDNIDNYYDDAYEKAFGSIPGLVTTDIIGGEGGVGGGEVDYSNTRNLGDEEYRSYVGGVPEYLTGFKTVTNIKDTKSAYGSIAGVSGLGGTSAVLSDHYGYDIIPTEAETRKFGGNLQTHTSSNAAELSEFQSLVKPILKEQIPYLQATEGLGYQDALMEAYKRDPMLQSLYAKYDVTPARQTKDGSSYLYDPMSYAEIRTKEVKDSSVKDAIKMAAIIAASVYGGALLSGSGIFGGAGAGATAAGSTTAATGLAALSPTAVAASLGATAAPGALGTALAAGTTSAAITGITGGDTNDILKSFALAGVGGYAKGLSANASSLGEAAKQAEGLALAGTFRPEHADLLKNAADATKAFEAATKTAQTFSSVVENGTFITQAVRGDVAGAVIGKYGDRFTTAALNKTGLNKEFLKGYNINQDDLTAGLVKTQKELAKGSDFGDALTKGLGEYIQEGGALSPNDPKTPAFIKKIGDAIRYTGKMFDDTIFEPVKDATKPVIDAAKAVGKKVDDKVFEPAKDTVKAAGSAIDDTTKPIRESVSDAVKAPIKAAGSALDDATKPVREGVSDAVKDAGSAVDDAVIQPVREALKDIDKPDVDLPSVDLPSIDTPNLGLSLSDILALLGGGGGGAGVRGGTPGIIQEEAAELFDLGDEEKEEEDALSAYLASIAPGNNVVRKASGGVLQSSYGNLFDTIHSRTNTSNNNLSELLRIVGDK